VITRDGRRQTADAQFRRCARLLLVTSALLFPSFLFQGCGKKGPPLAPLNMAPAPPQAVTARRLGDTVYVQLTVPDRGMAGRGPFSIDHVTVYAMTVAPGSPPPPNRELLKPEHSIAEIAVQPPPDPDAAEPETPDSRPRPGDVITFVEKLTAAQLTPAVVKPQPETKAPKPARGAALPPAAGNGAPAAPVGPQVLTRVYVVEGVPKKGRGAAPSARLEVPLLEAPGAPRPGSPSASESSVTVTWQPPPSTTDEAPGVLYNIYAASAAGSGAAGTTAERPTAPTPLNDKPIAEQTFTHAGAEPGKEQCFVVRSVAPVGSTMIESAASDPICITPKDTYPPAAPKGVAAVSSAGVINLIWDANQEGDLAGYLVLRGDAGGDRLQELFRDPQKETRYADRTVTAGKRYAYAVVAVDKAGNHSAQSNRVEEAAR
jgi:hypothetical protein